MNCCNLCISCYLKVSFEMSKTVKKGDFKAIKITNRDSFLKLTELINA